MSSIPLASPLSRSHSRPSERQSSRPLAPAGVQVDIALEITTPDVPVKEQRHVIIGTGPVGRALGQALVSRGIRAHFISQANPSTPLPGNCTHSVANAQDLNAWRSRLQGVTALYHCAQPPASKWEKSYVPLVVSVAQMAAECKVPLVLPQSAEAFGAPWASVITNRHPVAPSSLRGQLLAKAAAELFAMRSTHALQFAIVRAGDSFGPGITSGALGEPVFRAALRGQRVQLVGRSDASRSFNYIDDFGETLAALGGRTQQPEFWGRDWIAPQLGPLTPSQFAGFFRHAFGQNIATATLGKADLVLHAAFNRTARQALQRYYMYSKNYILDGSDLQKRLGQKPTPMLEAMTKTLAWYRQRE